MKVLMKDVKDGKAIISGPSVLNIMLHGIGPKSEHIVKWNHSMGNQISEPDMIRIARRVLRKADKSRKLEKFLPKVSYTKDIDRRIMRLRAMLGLDNEEKRILRFIIIENLDPLYSIDDLGDYKSAVIDIFLGIHHLAISKERIKHRNITINSLMFRRISGGKVQGVLSDWDSACNKETEGEYNRDEMYVGTRAFISKDLHIKKPLIHYEREGLVRKQIYPKHTHNGRNGTHTKMMI
ncbi:other 1 kinase [Pyrrhoderma noxium]|uniref:Other 1 kinase n=1 Tax=Pyrrhoderma noxium TaxID=2282107 RepID=A0A286UE32_9AGAM|nr:other 1 kinase [Pyrrhoderma noxium]